MEVRSAARRQSPGTKAGFHSPEYTRTLAGTLDVFTTGELSLSLNIYMHINLHDPHKIVVILSLATLVAAEALSTTATRRSSRPNGIRLHAWSADAVRISPTATSLPACRSQRSTHLGPTHARAWTVSPLLLACQGLGLG